MSSLKLSVGDQGMGVTNYSQEVYEKQLVYLRINMAPNVTLYQMKYLCSNMTLRRRWQQCLTSRKFVKAFCQPNDIYIHDLEF